MDVQKLSPQFDPFNRAFQESKAQNAPAESKEELRRAEQAKAARSAAAGGDEREKPEVSLEKRVIEGIKGYLKRHDTRLEYYVDKETRKVAIKIINNETQEVIREIPPEEVLNLAAKIEEFSGLLFDKLV